MKILKILAILLIVSFVWSVFISSGFSVKLLTLVGFKEHPKNSRILEKIQYSFDDIE